MAFSGPALAKHRLVPFQRLDEIALRHQQVAELDIRGGEITPPAGISGVEHSVFSVLDLRGGLIHHICHCAPAARMGAQKSEWAVHCVGACIFVLCELGSSLP